MTHRPSETLTLIDVETKDVVRRIHVLMCGHIVPYFIRSDANLKKRHCKYCHEKKMQRIKDGP